MLLQILNLETKLGKLQNKLQRVFLLIDNIKITQSGRFMFIDMYLDLPELIETKKYLCLSNNYSSSSKTLFLKIIKVYVSILNIKWSVYYLYK